MKSGKRWEKAGKRWAIWMEAEVKEARKASREKEEGARIPRPPLEGGNWATRQLRSESEWRQDRLVAQRRARSSSESASERAGEEKKGIERKR